MLLCFLTVRSISSIKAEAMQKSLKFELKNARDRNYERNLGQMNAFEMRNFNKMQYFIEIPVGSQNQPMQFLIDTGSSVSLLYSFILNSL